MSLASNEKIDQSAHCEAKLAEVRAAVDAGAGLEDPAVLEVLLSLEKKCRLSNDPPSTKKACVAIVALCKEKKDWPRLNALLKLISKRRQQMNVVVTAIVTEASAYLDEEGALPDVAAREALLVTLKEITDGKIFVEKERALLTRQLAGLKEAAGLVAEAADVLQEVHVETFGSLSKREKIDYIEEQMRLTLAKGDDVRAYILSKKVQRKTLGEDDYQDLKVRFYRLMIEYHTREREPFELAQHFFAIYSTPCVSDDEPQWREALASCVLFLALSPHTNHQADMMHRLVADERLEQLPAFHATLKLFTTPEIIAYPTPHQAELEAHACLHTKGDELFGEWRKGLHTRIVQHNVRVVAKYYKRVRLARLAVLLGLTEVRRARGHGKRAAAGGGEKKRGSARARARCVRHGSRDARDPITDGACRGARVSRRMRPSVTCRRSSPTARSRPRSTGHTVSWRSRRRSRPRRRSRTGPRTSRSCSRSSTRPATSSTRTRWSTRSRRRRRAGGGVVVRGPPSTAL